MTSEVFQPALQTSSPAPTRASATWLRGRALALVSFLTVVCFIAGVYTICGGPLFETNDDIGLSMIIAGIGFADRPDDHLHYSHFLVGRVLNALYTFNRSVPWYGVYLLLAQVVSLAVVTRVLLSKGKNVTGLFAAVVFLLCACIRPVFYMQFTTTAAMLASAGALLLLVAAERGKSLALRQLFPVLAFFTAGAMIRCESAKLVLLLAAFAIAARFFPRLEWRKLLIAAISVLVTLAAVFAVELSNRSYYSLDEWKEFHSLYSAYFPLIHKHIAPADPACVKAFESVGWSPADVGMFKRWYMLDSTKYSVDKINKVSASLPPIAPGVTFNYVMSTIIGIVTDLTIAPMLAAGVCLLLCLRRSRFSFWSGILFLTASSGLSLFLLIDLHLPARVYASIMSFSILVLLFYASPILTRIFSPTLESERGLPKVLQPVQAWLLRGLDRDGSGRIVRWQQTALCLVPFLIVINMLVVPFVSTYQGLSKKTQRESEALKESIKRLNPDPKNLYVVWGTSFPFERIRPFDNLNDYFADWKLVWMGAYARSPLVVSRLEQFGIHDPVIDCDKPNLFHISCSLFNGGMDSYLAQMCGKKLRVVPIQELAPCMYVCKLSKENPARCPETDASPLCPRFGSDDLVIFPSNRFDLKDLELLGPQKGSTLFKLTGADSKMVLRQPIEVDPQVFPTLCIESKIDPWIIDYRDVGIQVSDPVKRKRNIRLVATIQDGKLHRYAFDLRVKGLKSGTRVKIYDIRPVRTRNDSHGETITIKRIALVRKPIPSSNSKDPASAIE